MKLNKFNYVINHRPRVKNPVNELSYYVDYAIKIKKDKSSVLFLNLVTISRLQPLNPLIYFYYIVPEVIR
jgi:hypothetical protein